MGKYKVFEYVYGGEKYPVDIEFNVLKDKLGVIDRIKEKYNLNGHPIYLNYKQINKKYGSYEEASSSN